MRRDDVQILGGGLAGLAFAYFAKRAGFATRVYEASAHFGGNARTVRYEDCLVDTGAHRLHDRDPIATEAFRTLVGPELRLVEVPSRIIWKGRGLDFPIRPGNAAREMGLPSLGRILIERLSAPKPIGLPTNFEELAIQRYGPTLAREFLLGYSEKLWGCAADRLDPKVAGNRLQGLTVATILREIAFGARHATRHLDGSFFYPSLGFGMLADALVSDVGDSVLHSRAPVTRIRHDGSRVVEIEINCRPRQVDGPVISTVPLPRLVRLLDPLPDQTVLNAADSLRYRHLRLCIVRLEQARVSPYASLYFPEATIPFTRLYEPKNRSAHMAPPERTAAVLEVPCSDGDAWWGLEDEEFERRIVEALEATGLELGEVLSVHSARLSHAYPVLDIDADAVVQRLTKSVAPIGNLTLAGRAGSFRYLHTHDLFAEAHAWVEEHASSQATESLGVRRTNTASASAHSTSHA